MPDAELPSFCFYRPVPGELLHTACVECGHVLALHIGVEHCPVCEMVHLNQQAREASVTFDQVARGERTINDYRAARSLPPWPGDTVVVNVEGAPLDEGALRRVVEAQARRSGIGRR